MAVVDAFSCQTLGPRRAHVVLVADVDDRGAGDARHDRQRDRAKGDRRQDQVGEGIHDGAWIPREDRVDDREMSNRIDAETRVYRPRIGQQVQLDRKDEGQRIAQHEDRDGDPEERNDGHETVDPTVGMSRGEAAEGDAEADGEDQGADGQLDGDRESDREGVRDRATVDDARPKVAL